jgi:hypothetical protein
MAVFPTMIDGGYEVAVLCGSELCEAAICVVTVCDSVFSGIVVCEDELSGNHVVVCKDEISSDILLGEELHPVELCIVEVWDGEGLLSVDDRVDVLDCFNSDAFAAGEALDDTALEIVVVDVAKMFACEATALAAAGFVSVVTLHAVCGQPVYVKSSD